MVSKPRVCVDFDDTIWDGKQLLPGAREGIAKLHAKYTVAIFSARATEAERRQMEQLLRSHGIEFDEILPAKPDAVAYIDDKGIHFTSWDKVDC